MSNTSIEIKELYKIFGRTPKDYVETVKKGIADFQKRTGADELMLETDQDSMRRPMAMVQMRQLAAEPQSPRRA